MPGNRPEGDHLVDAEIRLERIRNETRVQNTNAAAFDEMLTNPLAMLQRANERPQPKR